MSDKPDAPGRRDDAVDGATIALDHPDNSGGVSIPLDSASSDAADIDLHPEDHPAELKTDSVTGPKHPAKGEHSPEHKAEHKPRHEAKPVTETAREPEHETGPELKNEAPPEPTTEPEVINAPEAASEDTDTDEAPDETGPHQLVVVQANIYRIQDKQPEYLLLKRIDADQHFWQPVSATYLDEPYIMEFIQEAVQEQTGIPTIKRYDSEMYTYEWDVHGVNGRDIIFSVEVDTDIDVTVDASHYSNYGWFQLDEAIHHVKWEGNKDSLRRLDEVLREELGLQSTHNAAVDAAEEELEAALNQTTDRADTDTKADEPERPSDTAVGPAAPPDEPASDTLADVLHQQEQQLPQEPDEPNVKPAHAQVATLEPFATPITDLSPTIQPVMPPPDNGMQYPPAYPNPYGPPPPPGYGYPGQPMAPQPYGPPSQMMPPMQPVPPMPPEQSYGPQEPPVYPPAPYGPPPQQQQQPSQFQPQPQQQPQFQPEQQAPMQEPMPHYQPMAPQPRHSRGPTVIPLPVYTGPDAPAPEFPVDPRRNQPPTQYGPPPGPSPYDAV